MTLKEWRYHALVMLGAAGCLSLSSGFGIAVWWLMRGWF